MPCLSETLIRALSILPTTGILLEIVVNAGNASADGSENLVRDCVGPGGDLVCADFRAALTTEEHNLISRSYISYSGNIEHSQIHTDSASDRSALTAHESCTAIGQQAGITVSITDR